MTITKKKVRHEKHVKINILVSLAALLIVATVLLGIAIDHHAVNDRYCETTDPTGCEVTVNILNDTATTYTVKQCVGDFGKPACRTLGDTNSLRPGMSQTANGTKANAPAQPWMVFDKHGVIKGCINLQFTKNVQSPITVPLSKLEPCNDWL